MFEVHTILKREVVLFAVKLLTRGQRERRQQVRWTASEELGHRMSSSREFDEARPVSGDVAVDPGLIVGHSGEDFWEAGQSTAECKTHHSTLDPLRLFVSDHQRAAVVPLHRSHMSVTSAAHSN